MVKSLPKHFIDARSACIRLSRFCVERMAHRIRNRENHMLGTVEAVEPEAIGSVSLPVNGYQAWPHDWIVSGLRHGECYGGIRRTAQLEE